MEATIKDKAIRSIGAFLERHEMEILETGWAHGKDKIDYVINDEGELVFIACNIRENAGKGIGDENLDRDMFERIAAAYLAEHIDLPEGIVRFDTVSMLILGDSKALLRHHRNALSVAGNDLD